LFSKRPIRIKLLIGLGLLVAVVVCLSSSGLYATYSYRSQVKNLSWRAVELPVAAELNAQVGDLCTLLSELRGLRAGTYLHLGSDRVSIQMQMVRDQFTAGVEQTAETLDTYRQQLQRKLADSGAMADTQKEWQTVHKLEAALSDLQEAVRSNEWMLDDLKIDRIDAELERFQRLAAELPSHLHKRLQGLAVEVRGQYRALILGAWIASITALLIFLLFLRLFYQWILLPLRILIGGSRRVAGGEFTHRIQLESDDEMAELAEALNSMTARFQAIRDDLDRQVQERTKQVVRNEELASVGFLAAGVAHEINNPLASIALCAESLESRTRDLLREDNPDHAVIVQYLRMIQSEAFRCKEITEKLLDFSRIGEVKRQETELGELVQGVIEMVHHLGKYQRKRIELYAPQPVVAWVNAREIKQVALNLLTNALDCTADDGQIWVRVERCEGMAELVVADDGCGMEPEVLDHAFEPFFTRRVVGQGTGLGLSITHRIVADHGGEITAASAGPGRGATFRVRLPLVAQQKETPHQHAKAA
jgi:two-component system NtrC family sensor kinase